MTRDWFTQLRQYSMASTLAGTTDLRKIHDHRQRGRDLPASQGVDHSVAQLDRGPIARLLVLVLISGLCTHRSSVPKCNKIPSTLSRPRARWNVRTRMKTSVVRWNRFKMAAPCAADQLQRFLPSASR